MRDGGPHLARPALLAHYPNGHHVDTQPRQNDSDSCSLARAVVRRRGRSGRRVRLAGQTVRSWLARTRSALAAQNTYPDRSSRRRRHAAPRRSKKCAVEEQKQAENLSAPCRPAAQQHIDVDIGQLPNPLNRHIGGGIAGDLFRIESIMPLARKDRRQPFPPRLLHRRQDA
jgi:hypothetical protein